MNRFAPFTLAAFLVLTASSQALEPWANTNLSITHDLELWFDASAENAARVLTKLPQLNPGAELDLWHDGSGNARHVRQRVKDSRPHLHRASGAFFVRFDGQNDFLDSAIAPVARNEGTIFVFAAPRGNPGGFRGMLSWNAVGKNDYQSGFNLDLGNAASTNWNFANIETAGAAGEKNLLKMALPFSQFHTLTVNFNRERLRFYVDSVEQQNRSRKPSAATLDELTLGARFNDGAGGTPAINGYFDGEIAEIIVYGQVLADAERKQVEQYLSTKYAALSRWRDDPFGPVEKPFVTVSNPPPVQMLAPGFEARQLPLELNNINNLVYAPDGRLFALGYDGNVFQLKDTDGDGLEDKADYFFKNERNEIPATIGMAWGPGGLYLPTKGRIIRLRDKGDGTSELETVSSGWVAPAKFGGSSLDAVAITVDKEGAVYFGLGCDDWTGAYRVNKQTGQSDYNVRSERGTILRLSPDWKHREILATGLRWPSSLAFNSEGDLFCTDQEGATWLPNGNPFDELLQIQRGRHYGFPPRHPKYLPGVIDEPSVFDYAPQHESTCGLHFNDQVKTFGPEWWRGDAIIAGESRGKIWRTKLVKTAAGYVGQNQIIACLNMLTIDAVPSPKGDLIVTCHSGLPDWGTGPQGKGKLFKISFTGAPQPVLAYAAGPTETRIIFDQPIDAARLKNLTARSAVTMGKYVTAGDRFESFRPGYQVVQNQMMEPRFELPVLSAGIAPDGRSVSLQTAPRTAAMNYAVKLPELTSSMRSPATLPQERTIDVRADLTGVETEWRDSSERWSGWLPHLDSGVAQNLTRASAEHQRLFELMRHPGTLKMRAQLDLWLMLHPVTQPGSTLDFEYPPETVTLVFTTSAGHTVTASRDATIEKRSDRETWITTKPVQDRWLSLEISVTTGSGETLVGLAWHTADDPRPRALPLRRILAPWATPKPDDSPAKEREIPEIAGGNWARGKTLFFSEQAACYKCHQIGGEGGKIGPDLSNLVHRDYASVLKDITLPSAAINPDHLAYNVELKNGEVQNGVILSDSPDELTLGLVDGKTLRVARSSVAAVKPSAISLMPENLLQDLSPLAQKDLFTFLLSTPRRLTAAGK